MRPAATLLLVRDAPLAVLMVERSAGGSYASATVFPGGGVDPEDAAPEWLPLVTGAEMLDDAERAHRIAAIRETWEEAGILLAVDAEGRDAAAPCPDGDFREAVAAAGLRLPLERLVPIAHWITPEGPRKRFDTRFYVAAAPAGQAATCNDVETTAVVWLEPHQALEEARDGRRNVVFPTYMTLGRLVGSTDVAAALATAEALPRVPVCARVERRPEGVVMHLPAAAGYGMEAVLVRTAGPGAWTPVSLPAA